MGDNQFDHSSKPDMHFKELANEDQHMSKSARRRLRKNSQKPSSSSTEESPLTENISTINSEELATSRADSTFWGNQVSKSDSQESIDSSTDIPSTKSLEADLKTLGQLEPEIGQLENTKAPQKQTDPNMESVDVHVSDTGNDYLYQKEIVTAMNDENNSNQENMFNTTYDQPLNYEFQSKTVVRDVPIERNARESSGFDMNRNQNRQPEVQGFRPSYQEQNTFEAPETVTVVREANAGVGQFQNVQNEGIRERRPHENQQSNIRISGQQPHYEEKTVLPSFQPVGTQWLPEHPVHSATPNIDSPMAEFDIEKRRTESNGQARQRRSRPLSQYIRDLVYWRNTKDSGVIFGFGLLLMLSLSYFSIISIFAYLSMTTMILVTSFVLIRQIALAFQQQSGDHPFRLLLEKDVVISPEYAHQQLDNVLKPLNGTMVRIRNLYLADSLGQTLKLIFFMYILTYIGSWFNLLTLLTLVWIAAFTVPKFYEAYKDQIDSVLHLVMEGIHDIKAQFSSKLNKQLSKIRPAAPRNIRNRPTGSNGGQIRARLDADGKNLEAELEIDTGSGRPEMTYKYEKHVEQKIE